MLTSAYRLRPAGDPDDGEPRGMPPFGRPQGRGEDLPYKVELWDMTKAAVEQVLAVTASASIGYAAYFAATREFPDRYITLRHMSGIISRWNGPSH